MNNQITVIVPMAGKGKRFADAGWIPPKPFIDINGRMMSEYVLEGLDTSNMRLVLVLRDDFLPSYEDKIQRMLQAFAATPVYVHSVTQGAACTVLAARQYFGEGPIVIADSDTFFRPPLFKNFVHDALQRRLDISLLTMPENNPAYSYALTDAEGKLLDVAEKEVISSHAICGAYYFSKKKYFIEPLIELLIYGRTVKNEYYLSQVCRESLKLGASGGIFEAQLQDILCMGTPEQLKAVTPYLQNF